MLCPLWLVIIWWVRCHLQFWIPFFTILLFIEWRCTIRGVYSNVVRLCQIAKDLITSKRNAPFCANSICANPRAIMYIRVCYSASPGTIFFASLITVSFSMPTEVRIDFDLMCSVMYNSIWFLILLQILLEGILYRVLSVDIYSSGLNKSLIKVSNFICSMATATDQPRRFPDAYEK